MRFQILPIYYSFLTICWRGLQKVLLNVMKNLSFEVFKKASSRCPEVCSCSQYVFHLESVNICVWHTVSKWNLLTQASVFVLSDIRRNFWRYHLHRESFLCICIALIAYPCVAGEKKYILKWTVLKCKLHLFEIYFLGKKRERWSYT